MRARRAFLVLTLFGSTGCDDEPFAAAPSTTGGSGGGGGSAGAAGSGGSVGGAANGGSAGSGAASLGGGAGSSGNAGSGGAAEACVETASCPEGHYCGGLGSCQPCNDLGSLEDLRELRFGTPEPLSRLNEGAAGASLRFPRVFGSGRGLIYQRDFFGGEIWLTGNLETDVGAPLSSPVGDPGFVEGSALWLSSGEDRRGVLAPFNFVFNRALEAGAANELLGAQIAANGSTAGISRLPAPFNTDQPTLESSYSMALSRDRAWWMVNRDSRFDVRFYTAPLDGSAPASIVTLELANGCAAIEFDLAAWVTLDGKLLFVSVTERQENCDATMLPQTMDIVVYRLNEMGQPLGPGIPLVDINRPKMSEVDASLSADMCWLYFAAQQDSGLLTLMRARREH